MIREMSFPLVIDLGWPDKVLSPNARPHFMQLSRVKKVAREEAFWATRVVMPLGYQHDGSKLAFRITAYPPDKRTRDDDNVKASLKAARDGIAQALGIDDSMFAETFEWGEVKPSGGVQIEVGDV